MKVVPLLLLLLLGACRPLYLPPVPATIEPTPRLGLDSSSRVIVRDARPAVEFLLEQVPEPGWLAFQWFDPGNVEVASDSLWVSVDDVGLRRVLSLPPVPAGCSGGVASGDFVRRNDRTPAVPARFPEGRGGAHPQGAPPGSPRARPLIRRFWRVGFSEP